MAILPNFGSINDLKSAATNAASSASSALGSAAFGIADTADTMATGAMGALSKMGSAAGGLAFDIADTADTMFSSAKNAVSGALTSVQARLSNAKLTPGGAPAAASAVGKLPSSPVSLSEDWRLRISVGASSGIFYKKSPMAASDMLAPLFATDGVLFPFTPTVTVSYVNNYSPLSVTHSNNSVQSYINSDVSSISVSGAFAAQTPAEAKYVMAAIHFFRSASKMFFGTSDTGNAGSPPPILFLNGFGQSYFPNVPVILTSFSHTMPDDVDYITYPNPAAKMQSARIPTMSTITLTLIPQYSRATTTAFNLDKFASGDLLQRGFI